MKLKHSIYVMIFLCSFVPVCFWINFSIADTEVRMERVISSNIEAITGSHVMSIENFCEGRKESMETISRYDLIRNALLQDYVTEVNTELNKFLADNKENKSFVASLSVVDRDFHVVGSSEKYKIYEISEFKYTNEKYHTGEFIMDNVYERETDDGLKRIIPAYIGIYHQDELIGYLIEEINCTYFDRLRLQTDFLEEGTLYLVDGKHSIITAGTGLESESRQEAMTTEEERSSYQEAWESFDHENYSSGMINYEFDGQKYMTYFSDIDYTDWEIRVTENMSAQWASNRSFQYLIMAEGCFMIAAMLMVQFMVAKRLSEPFKQIIETMRNVRENHDYSLRTDLRRNDEVGIISEGIDELLEYIEKEELEEKRKQREFAEEARLRAEASSRAKSTFLFHASHDIRTPMNAIQGFAHIIEDNSGNEALVLDSVRKIKKSSATLLELLNNVLELSKIESGKDELNIQALNLKDLLDKIYLMFAQEMSDKGIAFEQDYHVSDGMVQADELKCTRILMNMLGNAKKFTPKGGNVVLGLHQLSEQKDGYAEYRFFVRDTGIGMSPEFQERAFEQFETERTSTISGLSGSGLGLSIIKKLTELMGGRCTLFSKQGEGTEIDVTLSLHLAESVDQDVEETIKMADLSGKRVLLVEDNELNREIARYLLESLGIMVDEAENGAAALEKLKNARVGHYDLVFMDLQMPVMDGYEATVEIRTWKETELSNIPIVAMTANAFKEDRERCLAVGMNDHVGKPLELNQLYMVLESILG